MITNINYEGYLTEQKLGEVLREVYHSTDGYLVESQFKHGRYKYDYAIFQNSDLFLLFEFDGFKHFCNSKTQERDFKKDVIALNTLSVPISRIPYFVQLRQDVVPLGLPLIQVASSVQYPHGFIDPVAMHPKDFNHEGFKKFFGILLSLPRSVREEIWNSAFAEPMFYYEKHLL